MAATTPRVLFSSSAGSESLLSEMLPFADVSYFGLLPKPIRAHRLAQGTVLQTLKRLISHIEARTDPIVALCCQLGEGVLFKPLLETRSDIQEVILTKSFLRAELKNFPERPQEPEEPSLKRSYSDSLENLLAEPSVEVVKSSERLLSRSSYSAGSTLASKTVPLLPLEKLKEKEEAPEKPIENVRSYDEIRRSHSCSSSSRRSSLELYRAARSSSQPKRLSPPETNDGEIDLENVSSASIRFSPLETSHYPETLQKVLDYIYRGLRAEQLFLEITLYNVDCLFFVHLLSEICKDYICSAILKPNYVIRIELKRELNIPEALRQIQRQKDQLSKDLHSADPEVKEAPLTPRSAKTNTFALLDTCSSFLECSSSPRNAFFSASSALARLHHPSDASGSSSSSQITKRKTYSLAISYLSYKLQYEPPLEGKGKWKRLWEDVERCLPKSSSLSSKLRREKIKRLSILRSDTEKNFFPLDPINIESEQSKIDLYQALRRTLFMDEPLTSIWINGRPLEMLILGKEPESTAEVYYYSLIQTLAERLGEANLNIPSFVSSLIALHGDTAFFPKKPEEMKLISLLKASSFSFFGKALETLQKIVEPLLGKHYEFKFIKQTQTVEFFLTNEGDFTVIRTERVPFQKNGEEKAEFVLKWIVSCQRGQFSCALKIPVIDVASSCSLKEHKLIYDTFSAYQRQF